MSMVSEPMEQEAEILTVVFDDGTEESLEVVALLDLEEPAGRYILLQPVENSESDLYVFRVVGEEDKMEFESVDDEEEWRLLEDVITSLFEENEQG